ncbi:MAG: glutathione S-transferase family protein [Alphaproteobacteria bacterium]|nr:glutathione S-transferase family protein [Alphaproteobacteria bacterium]MDX5367843.1 glutathione S-transferase family protein [Alphaproteobacteria bacterium]MDX5462716.1 glutathione S-transferase family protein [Alphaproteobacteria bacterium]
MITLWGRANSINVQKVLWTCEELGLEIVRHDVGGPYGGTDTPEYRAMNPNGLVPTLQDGDVTVWESNAVVRYLAARYGAGSLWPEDPGVRAAADKWMDWQLSTAQPHQRTLIMQVVRTPPEKRDTAAVAAAMSGAAQALELLEGAFGDGAFLVGDGLTIADVALGPMMHRFVALDVPRPRLPKLEAWYARLTDRPGFARHVMPPLS